MVLRNEKISSTPMVKRELLADVYQLLGYSELLKVCPQQLPIDAVEGFDEVQGQAPYISPFRAVALSGAASCS
jgi:hypothetical protein